MFRHGFVPWIKWAKPSLGNHKRDGSSVTNNKSTTVENTLDLETVVIQGQLGRLPVVAMAKVKFQTNEKAKRKTTTTKKRKASAESKLIS